MCVNKPNKQTNKQLERKKKAPKKYNGDYNTIILSET